MDSFALLAYASLADLRTLLQRLLAYLNFTLESEIYPFATNENNDFYGLWQQHKKLKTMEMMDVAWPDIFYTGYINQFQPKPTHKIH